MADLTADMPAGASDPRISACPACDAVPLAEGLAGQGGKTRGDIILSLPAVHCATCISDVERVLHKHPGVRDARVNLTLRRVTIDAPGHTAEDMIPVVESIGYEAHELDPAALSATAADRQGRDLLMRIGVSGFAMMNVMILSVAVWSGADAATRDMFHMISGAIALPTVAFAGKPFFASAWRSISHGRLGMDVPISLALILASAISVYETFNSGRHAYFDGAVMLCFFLLIGRYLDYRTRAVARSAAEELTALEVPRATLVVDGAEQVVSVADLRPGDLIRIRPGNRVAADGEVVEGWSELDRSILTGESQPVQAGPGMALSAGEVNLTGPLTLRVTAAGRDSSLSRLAELVAATESARTRYSTLAERAARGYAPAVHLLAFSSFIVWMYLTGGDWRFAVNVAAAVLIITCPCALGLAVPAVVTAASGRLFRRGLLIKNGTALERLAEVDTVVFDKTGTLTLGTPQPVDLSALDRQAQGVALALAQGSDHPLSRGLAQALRLLGVAAADVTGLRELPGHGVQAEWQGQVVRLGRGDWVAPGAPDASSLTQSWLALGDAAPLAISFEDQLRPGAADCVAALLGQGLRVILLSGDRPAVVQETAARLGITEWQAGVTPVEKAHLVSSLTAEGRKPLMVGDGLNDTAALAGAHVSISPATGLDAARVASDIVLMGQDLAPVADALETAGRARRRIKENFAISFGYNVVAVPIALVGLATPLLAALAMSISSITVTLNALRLR
ncbi:MAG: heavy metal translocating P-type ATPase [Paracoccus sp. (in: a-proteobacteria)]|uniref:heavy metal translocating P-type ATPase n=1 Tax=Paracoccus sp. TaxID=267 RepID=UPI0026DEF9B9|nr:heavy metal translocating P-type ATPase [Paracoccus sp. (in: a-proteobacteria)]MDO5620588.1 heavy metal translocating P-type ATPase [Paracoccus sp. (in: a-proteobacteria)]